jgi:hypothetical protein
VILAKDKATRNVWKTDPDFKDSSGSNSTYKPFEAAETYYLHHFSPSKPYAFYHRAVPVKGIFILK